MAIYAIADLHLPGGDIKPMDVFGTHWAGHFERISQDWIGKVGDEDIVLLPGDLSWAMALSDAKQDLEAIGSLPGKKVILRGNHDYWWSGIGRVRDALPENMYAIQNDCLRLNDTLICGTRGWLLPGDQTGADDMKIYQRELLRLNMTLMQARRLSEDASIVCMMHFPPLTDGCRDTGFVDLLEQYRVEDVVYGHLHGSGIKSGFKGEHRGIRFHLVSCDALNFQLYCLPGTETNRGC
ncbi:MAG: metallophosphoesterase [Clostridia bacterium]|nr:metallophosphoesterase [Clostridia bacterium]